MNRLPPYIVLFASVILTALACTPSGNEPVTLWTSEPELTDYLTWYNANVDGPPVEVRAIDRGSGYRRLRESDTPPDLIVDRNLVKVDAPERYRSLNTIVEGRRDAFYTPILRAGASRDTQYLLPLSFDVPAVMFAGAWSPPQDDRLSIEIETLIEAAREWNSESGGRPVRMGYSPLWQQEFLHAALDMYGARFRSGPETLPLWSREAIDVLKGDFQSWSEENNEGPAVEDDFRSRYLVAPGNRAVQSGEAGFWFTTAARYYSLPDAETAGLDVRWLSRNGVISVGDRVLWAAIPSRASNREGAEAVLRWLSDEHAQGTMIRAAYRSSEPSFGFASGFSTLKRVNERDLSEAAPELTGRIPVSSHLRGPDVEHALWPQMAQEAILPWLDAELRESNGTESLTDRLQGWIRQQEW